MALIICNVLNAFWKKISGTFIKIDQFLVDVPDNHNDILETIYSSLTLFSLKKEKPQGKMFPVHWTNQNNFVVVVVVNEKLTKLKVRFACIWY